ncbi:MAG: glycosyltransferase, partial [Pseudomonadota bacterium]|nr:glycosyltransferase [Pseudomonadota bacterium]
MRKLLQVMAGAAVGGAEEFFMRLAPALSRACVDQRLVIREHAERRYRLENAGIAVTEARFGGILDFATKPTIKSEINQFAPDLVLAWMSR